MECALRPFRLPVARLILSAKGDRPAADVFNHKQALFLFSRVPSLGARYASSSEAVEWALDTCIAESSPERPFGGLDLVWNGVTLLHYCARRGKVSPRIAQLLRHQLMER